MGQRKLRDIPWESHFVQIVYLRKSASNGRLDGNEDVKIEGYPLVESLAAYGGVEIGSSNRVSDGNGYGKSEVYPLG